MKKTNAEYQRDNYKKWYKKAINNCSLKNSYNMNKGKETKREKDKWRQVFEYIYMLWKEGIKIQNTEKFTIRMTLKKFQRLWCDKKDIVDNLYSQLQSFNDRSFERIN